MEIETNTLNHQFVLHALFYLPSTWIRYVDKPVQAASSNDLAVQWRLTQKCIASQNKGIMLWAKNILSFVCTHTTHWRGLFIVYLLQLQCNNAQGVRGFYYFLCVYKMWTICKDCRMCCNDNTDNGFNRMQRRRGICKGFFLPKVCFNFIFLTHWLVLEIGYSYRVSVWRYNIHVAINTQIWRNKLPSLKKKTL